MALSVQSTYSVVCYTYKTFIIFDAVHSSLFSFCCFLSVSVGLDPAEQQAQELLKRRQRRILQLVKDFRSNNTVDVENVLRSQVLTLRVSFACLY